MRKTLLKIQSLLDDLRQDAKLLKIDLLVQKVEKISQLFEGVIREIGSNEKNEK